MHHPTDPDWWRVRIGKVPVVEGLRPLLGLDVDTLHALAALRLRTDGYLDTEDQVPRLGQITTVELGRDPGYFSPAEILALAGLPDDDVRCTFAVPNLYGSWYEPERAWTTGLLLTHSVGQAFLFDTTLRAWQDVLIDKVGHGVHPDLILCTQHRWALGVNYDGDSGAVARW